MYVPQPRKLPSGNWNVKMVLGGKSISITKPTAKECTREAEFIKAGYKSGKRSEAFEDKKTITLRDAIDRYIEARSDVLSPCTIRGYRVAQRNYFQSVADKDVRSVDWQREVNAMSRKYAPKTVKNAWRFVSSVLAENGIESKKITLPKQEVKERPFLDSEQIREFTKMIEGKEVEIPALLGLHSLRRSEIAALDWKDVDLKRKTIRVHQSLVPDEDNNLVLKKTTKNSTSTRTIPIMIPQLYDALSAVEDKHGAVCTMHPNSIYKAVNTICEANNLPLIGVHGLRHSFVSLCYKLHLTEMQCMELGGYADFSTMRAIYTHLASLEKEDARTILTAFFEQNRNDNRNEN